MFKTKQNVKSIQSKFDEITKEKFTRSHCEVWVTNDYELFSFKDGNRPIRESHLNNIRDSIASKQIAVPIVVDENLEICDGQNRFLACKELKKPVYYIIIDGLTLEDVQRLNANTKTWSPDDFLESYCQQGYSEYIKFKRFKRKYEFGHSECLVLLGGWKRKKRNRNVNQNFKEGDFRIIDYAEAVAVADKITRVKKYFDGYRTKCFISAMLRLFKNPEYDHSQFLNKLSTQTAKMTKQANTESYLTLIEEIYNFRSKNKIRLFTY